MRFFLIAIVVLWSLPGPVLAAEIDLVFRHGKPIDDHAAAWAGHIEYASWIDDELIVYFSRGDVTCMSTKSREIRWVIRDVGQIEDWSISRQTKRLAYLNDLNITSVIDCTTGKKIFSATEKSIAKILGLDFALVNRIAIAPDDGRLIVCTFSAVYGRNAYIVAPSYTKLLSSFDIDASPNEVSLSANGCRVAVIADAEVLCVRDLVTNRDLFFRGTRITKEPDSFGVVVDAPFFSHLRDGGRDHIVYTLDNSWATGKVFVQNLKSKGNHSFDARNGHIEIDVSFPTNHIALTGTSTDLIVLDFEGNVIAEKKKATMQRNSCIEFSPTADRILVGSWDNTISVFSVNENVK